MTKIKGALDGVKVHSHKKMPGCGQNKGSVVAQLKNMPRCGQNKGPLNRVMSHSRIRCLGVAK